MVEQRLISFEEILPVWSKYLWPNRKSPIKPLSSIKYLGGYDMAIYNNKPTFIGLFADTTLIGVNSGFLTSPNYYRVRGIYIFPEYRGKNLSELIFSALDKIALDEGAKYVWSMPRKSALSVYLRHGFLRTSDWFEEGVEFGPNCYVNLELFR